MRRAALVLGAVGTTLMTLGGAVVGTAPFRSVRPDDWLGYLVAYTGLTILVATWLWVGWAVRRGGGPSRPDLQWMLGGWSVPLLLGAPLYSRDVYSYVAQGRMAELGINPYLHGPLSLGDGPYLDAVSHVWRATPAPYGPLFVGIASVVTRVFPGPLSAAFGMRLAVLPGVVLLAVFLPRLARQNGVPEQVALWLGVLNPLVLLHLVAGGHNDALMLGLVVVGLVLAGDDQPVAGIVVCTLAGAVKGPALLAVVYIAADLVRSREGWSARGRTAAFCAALAASTLAVVTWLVGYGWGWLSAVGTPGRVRSALAPSWALGHALARLGLGSDGVPVARWLCLVAAAVVMVELLRRRDRYGSLWSLAVSLLVLVVLGPVIQPWYLLWGLVLLAAAGPGRLLALAVWISVVLPYMVQPNGSSAADIVLLVFLALTAVVGVLSTTRAEHVPILPLGQP
ncbi:MAG TPA: polyprenol phosphomannose-dependent alpha 1,6 mannosyltransferase MptB [Acidimicrobiales bacterium]